MEKTRYPGYKDAERSALLIKLLLQISNISGIPASKTEALKNNKASYLSVDYMEASFAASTYPGYQLLEKNLNGAEDVPFGFPGIEPPLSFPEIVARLDGLIKGIEWGLNADREPSLNYRDSPEPLRLIEIVESEAIKLYNEGYVVYIHCIGVRPDTSNTFIMRKNVKDANLNFYLAGRDPSTVPLQEYINYIQRNQAEPIRFHTYGVKELITLD